MNTEKVLINRLVGTLLRANSPEKMLNRLETLLTSSELETIATRLEILRLLKQGLTQREIAKQLGVGIATVTRGARELKQGNLE